MRQPFDFWSLPILLAAFNYEYRIHQAFTIPNESTLTDELNTVAEEMKKLRQEQQQYIRTASEEGKLMADTDPDSNLYVRSPLPTEYEDDVAATLENYTARRKRLESRFTAAYHELPTYREIVRDELKKVGDRYSDYFNKAPEHFRALISKVYTEGERQSKILAEFRGVVLRQFHNYGAANIEMVNTIRHQYSTAFLPDACGRANFLGSGSYHRPTQERVYWKADDWPRINDKLRNYSKILNEKIEEVDRAKNYTESEMEAYSFHLGIVEMKFVILDYIYNVISPAFDRSDSFDFNEPMVEGFVLTGEQEAFKSWLETVKENFEQRKAVLKHIIDVEYRRFSDSVEGYRSKLPRPRNNDGNSRLVFHRSLAAACCRHHWDDC